MDDKIPYIVFEGAQARSERTIKRIVIALIITVAMLFASNALWLWAWSQYDYTSEEISIDGPDGMATATP